MIYYLIHILLANTQRKSKDLLFASMYAIDSFHIKQIINLLTKHVAVTWFLRCYMVWIDDLLDDTLFWVHSLLIDKLVII